jgi:hypothetical protein
MRRMRFRTRRRTKTRTKTRTRRFVDHVELGSAYSIIPSSRAQLGRLGGSRWGWVLQILSATP